jgi:hypothetical protein
MSQHFFARINAKFEKQAAISGEMRLSPLGDQGSPPGLPDLSWYNIPKLEKYTK